MVENSENRVGGAVAPRRLAPAAGLFGFAGELAEPREIGQVAERFYRIGFRDGRLTRAAPD